MTLLSAFPVLAQDTIYWENSKPLDWKDFQGKPKRNAIGSAEAATGVALKFRYQEDAETAIWTYEYQVQSYFLTKKSWSKAQDRNSYLLAHEQNHFDISELYARKLKRELSKLTPSEKLGEDAKEIYHRMQVLHASTQSKYDRETKHSLNINEELEWQEKIRDSLKQYHD